jgi:hypothetical protein
VTGEVVDAIKKPAIIAVGLGTPGPVIPPNEFVTHHPCRAGLGGIMPREGFVCNGFVNN